MDTVRARSRRPNGKLARAALEFDRASIQAGIALVAARHARRVVLSGLPSGERLLAQAVEEGLAAGVRVRLDRGTSRLAALILTPLES
jgi:hypothetical protein